MNIVKKLYSRNFFIANLVLLGIILGFGLAYTGFSRAAKVATSQLPSVSVRAETPLSSAPADIKAALAQAEAVQTAFRYVAQKVQPSIVELNVVEKATRQTQQTQDQLPWRFFFGPEQAPDNSTTPQEQGLGSGIIVRQSGKTFYVLTNNHVAGNASEITVITRDDKEYKAELVGSDARKDLALVKFETDAQDISVATLGDSSDLMVGDWAIAIGSPFGLVSSVTAGIVSAVGRSGGPDGNISDFIQTDAAINKGNSGGALVNIRGEVVGMNTWIASPTGGSIGLGFAIPINGVKKAIDDFITRGKVEYGWIGVSLGGQLDKATAAELGTDPKKGSIAVSVYRQSPAEKGGVLPGDVVLKVNGEEIKSTDHLVRVVGDLPVGKTAEFLVLRDGRQTMLKVTIEARDPSVATQDGNAFPGITVISLDSEDIKKDELPKNAKGVLIVSVADKSAGAIVGLKAGDIVSEINDKPVAGVREFYRAVNDAANKKLQFTVTRDGETVTTVAYVKK
jgi:Do/DeqQ family serine protease